MIVLLQVPFGERFFLALTAAEPVDIRIVSIVHAHSTHAQLNLAVLKLSTTPAQLDGDDRQRVTELPFN
jgi:hypothetical protein